MEKQNNQKLIENQMKIIFYYSKKINMNLNNRNTRFELTVYGILG